MSDIGLVLLGDQESSKGFVEGSVGFCVVPLPDPPLLKYCIVSSQSAWFKEQDPCLKIKMAECRTWCHSAKGPQSNPQQFKKEENSTQHRIP